MKTIKQNIENSHTEEGVYDMDKFLRAIQQLTEVKVDIDVELTQTYTMNDGLAANLLPFTILTYNIANGVAQHYGVYIGFNSICEVGMNPMSFWCHKPDTKENSMAENKGYTLPNTVCKSITTLDIFKRKAAREKSYVYVRGMTDGILPSDGFTPTLKVQYASLLHFLNNDAKWEYSPWSHCQHWALQLVTANVFHDSVCVGDQFTTIIGELK